MSNDKDKGTTITPKSKDKGDSRLKTGSVKDSKAKTKQSTGKAQRVRKSNREVSEQGKADTKVLAERVNKSQIKYTLEHKTKLTHAILSIYATGKYTLESCCEAQGITDRTFRDWLYKHPELSILYEEYKITMREVSKEELRKLAEKSLEKLVKGGEFEESTTVLQMVKGKDGIMKAEVKEVRKVKKVVQPNTAAVLFTLTNLDPKQWRNTQLIEGKITATLQAKALEKLNDEELDAEIDRLSKAPITTPDV